MDHRPTGRTRGVRRRLISVGAWNVIIQSVFDRFSSGPGATVRVGESGVVTAATVWLAYFIIRRAPWAGTTPAATVGARSGLGQPA